MKEIKQLDKNTVSIDNAIYYKVSKRTTPNIVLVNNISDTLILGEIIRDARKKQNLTQAELATKANVTIAAVANSESSNLKDTSLLLNILTALDLIIVI